MGKFTKFAEWETSKYSKIGENETAGKPEAAPELMAKVADLVAKRKSHIKNKEDFEVQILDIDIKLLKLELEKLDLQAKRQQLTGAKDIATRKRTEGKTHEE
jgi:hypothetical protein